MSHKANTEDLSWDEAIAIVLPFVGTAAVLIAIAYKNELERLNFRGNLAQAGHKIARVSGRIVDAGTNIKELTLDAIPTILPQRQATHNKVKVAARKRQLEKLKKRLASKSTKGLKDRASNIEEEEENREKFLSRAARQRVKTAARVQKEEDPFVNAGKGSSTANSKMPELFTESSNNKFTDKLFKVLRPLPNASKQEVSVAPKTIAKSTKLKALEYVEPILPSKNRPFIDIDRVPPELSAQAEAEIAEHKKMDKVAKKQRQKEKKALQATQRKLGGTGVIAVLENSQTAVNGPTTAECEVKGWEPFSKVEVEALKGKIKAVLVQAPAPVLYDVAAVLSLQEFEVFDDQFGAETFSGSEPDVQAIYEDASGPSSEEDDDLGEEASALTIKFDESDSRAEWDLNGEAEEDEVDEQSEFSEHSDNESEDSEKVSLPVSTSATIDPSTSTGTETPIIVIPISARMSQTENFNTNTSLTANDGFMLVTKARARSPKSTNELTSEPAPQELKSTEETPLKKRSRGARARAAKNLKKAAAEAEALRLKEEAAKESANQDSDSVKLKKVKKIKQAQPILRAKVEKKPKGIGYNALSRDVEC